MASSYHIHSCTSALCRNIYISLPFPPLKRADSKLCWRWVFKHRWQRQGWPRDPMTGVKGRTVIPNVSPVRVCVCACVRTHACGLHRTVYHTHAWQLRRPEEGSIFPELELQTAVSHHMGAGIEPQPSERTVRLLTAELSL